MDLDLSKEQKTKLEAEGFKFCGQSSGHITPPKNCTYDFQVFISKHNERISKHINERNNDANSCFIDYMYLYSRYQHSKQKLSDLMEKMDSNYKKDIIPNLQVSCKLFLEKIGYVFHKHGKIVCPENEPILKVDVFVIGLYRGEFLPHFVFKGYDFNYLYNNYFSKKESEFLVRGQIHFRV